MIILLSWWYSWKSWKVNLWKWMFLLLSCLLSGRRFMLFWRVVRIVWWKFVIVVLLIWWKLLIVFWLVCKSVLLFLRRKLRLIVFLLLIWWWKKCVALFVNCRSWMIVIRLMLCRYNWKYWRKIFCVVCVIVKSFLRKVRILFVLGSIVFLWMCSCWSWLWCRMMGNYCIILLVLIFMSWLRMKFCCIFKLFGSKVWFWKIRRFVVVSIWFINCIGSIWIGWLK